MQVRTLRAELALSRSNLQQAEMMRDEASRNHAKSVAELQRQLERSQYGLFVSLSFLTRDDCRREVILSRESREDVGKRVTELEGEVSSLRAKLTETSVSLHGAEARCKELEGVNNALKGECKQLQQQAADRDDLVANTKREMSILRDDTESRIAKVPLVLPLLHHTSLDSRHFF